jgi:hypothetical protein
MVKVHTPYYEAAKKVLGGTPVKNLDDIREECNSKLVKLKYSGKPGYTPNDLVAVYVIDAENRILQGEDPRKVYSPIMHRYNEEKRKEIVGLVKLEVDIYLND